MNIFTEVLDVANKKAAHQTALYNSVKRKRLQALQEMAEDCDRAMSGKRSKKRYIPKGYVSEHKAAKSLSVSRQALHQMIHRGEILAKWKNKRYLIQESELERFL